MLWTNSKCIQRGGFSNCVVANGSIFSWIEKSVVWSFTVLSSYSETYKLVSLCTQLHANRAWEEPTDTAQHLHKTGCYHLSGIPEPWTLIFLHVHLIFQGKLRFPPATGVSADWYSQTWSFFPGLLICQKDGPNAQFWPVSKVWNFWKSFLFP